MNSVQEISELFQDADELFDKFLAANLEEPHYSYFLGRVGGQMRKSFELMNTMMATMEIAWACDADLATQGGTDYLRNIPWGVFASRDAKQIVQVAVNAWQGRDA